MSERRWRAGPEGSLPSARFRLCVPIFVVCLGKTDSWSLMWGARGSRRWQWEWSLPQAFKRLKSSSSSPVTLLVHASCLVWVEVLLASFEKVTRGPRPSASMDKTGRCSKDSQCSSDCESRLTLKVMVQPTIKLQSLSIRCNNLLTDMECSGMLWELLRHRKLNI